MIKSIIKILAGVTVLVLCIPIFNYALQEYDKVSLKRSGHSKVHPDISIYANIDTMNLLTGKYGKEMSVPEVDISDWQTYTNIRGKRCQEHFSI